MRIRELKARRGLRIIRRYCRTWNGGLGGVGEYVELMELYWNSERCERLFQATIVELGKGLGLAFREIQEGGC